MKVAIQNNHKKTTLKVVDELKKRLEEENITIDENSPDLLITVGGDGTLLSAFHRFAHQLNGLRFIGVHTGHLGFYTDWREYELEELVNSIKNDDGESVEYPLLDVNVRYNDGRQDNNFIALNEATIQKIGGTLVSDVFINDKHFECFRGDGLCVSTPTGSTGYNKSIGGAVLNPRLKALQMTEIASINNQLFRTLSSPLVIAEDEEIILDLTKAQEILITLDHITMNEKDVKSVRFKIADETIRFARYSHTHFWDRVSDAFIGEKYS
ncbi:MAG: NAD kinase [Atopostipes suicloacalis]|nr:NAD kinase [Atopostipes suicloacalis]